MQAFHYSACQENFAIGHLDPNQTCYLSAIVEPLQWITNQLKQQIHAIPTTVQKLKFNQKNWEVILAKDIIYSQNIILALGAEAKKLSYSRLETIPLDVALNQEKLPLYCDQNDTIAVFGSSHSAILILRNLIEKCVVKNIINFYRSPLLYATELPDGKILFDDTGLKGTTAEWAKNNLDGIMPANLKRVEATPENLNHYLFQCTKAVYAVGFQKRHLTIEGLTDSLYSPHNGIIGPGLFGLGIAFPQAKTNHLGKLEYRVGMWKFMDYLTSIMPVWLQNSQIPLYK